MPAQPSGRAFVRMLSLDSAVQYVRGVGPERAGMLESAGIRTVEDLLLVLPLRYEDRGMFATIASVRPGASYTLAGVVRGTVLRRLRGRSLSIFQAILDDGSGTLELVWFNQPYLDDQIRKGTHIVVHGPAKYGKNGLQLVAPHFELASREDEEEEATAASIHTGRIVPVYTRIDAIGPKHLRSIVANALAALAPIPETLPAALTARYALPPLDAAFREVHFPRPEAGSVAGNAESCRARLVYEDFLRFQLGLAETRARQDRERPGIRHQVTDEMRERVRAVLPFKLTTAQRRVIKEIVDDMSAAQPMARLLQGDVGSGKTIVALVAMLISVENGFQAVLMAPTGILAEQHAFNLRGLLAATPYGVELLTGSTPRAEREALLERLANGAARLLVGTHALIQEGVEFQRLGLVVVDEQHRFGVLQRDALRRKGLCPDLLVMTATPIPRSLALTLYGDLETSTLDELPPGRRPVKSVLRGASKRGAIFDFIRKELAAGAQAYIVVPLIEESPRLDVKALDSAYQEVCELLRGWVVAMLHGRMAGKEKESAMRQFARGSIHALVSTTVIEVGVDVPNASIMLIENAERFGLAQLHQLRGRVGRGVRQSYCVLQRGEKVGEAALERLRFFVAENDGFRIAEKDLELRGPGDIAGVRQSGVPLFRVGNLVRDQRWMERARGDAREIVAERLADPAAAALRGSAAMGWNERFGLTSVG